MNHYDLTLAASPAEPPTTVAQAKLYCRVDLSEDDTLVETLLGSAADFLLKRFGRSLVTQTWTLNLDRFDCSVGNVVRWECGWAIYLPYPPLQSVTWIKYIDTAGVQQTLVADTDYKVVLGGEHYGRVMPAYGKVWPVCRNQPAAVEIKYVAGYGLPSTGLPKPVPDEIKTKLWAYVSYCYRNRLEQDEEYLASLFFGQWTGSL